MYTACVCLSLRMDFSCISMASASRTELGLGAQRIVAVADGGEYQRRCHVRGARRALHLLRCLGEWGRRRAGKRMQAGVR